MDRILNYFDREESSGEGDILIGYYGFWALLTYLSVVSAIIGINFAFRNNFGNALICLMISGLFDMLDGRVASLKDRNERQKYYGIQIDALADIISFGVFPIMIGLALRLYLIPENSFFFGDVVNIFIYCMYLLAALIRLAYFNVIEVEIQDRNERREYYEGLPVTSVALLIPLIFSICMLINIDIYKIYTILLFSIAIAFVLRVKIPKPRGRAQLILILIGLPIFIYILLFGGTFIWV